MRCCKVKLVSKLLLKLKALYLLDIVNLYDSYDGHHGQTLKSVISKLKPRSEVIS